MLRSVGGAYQPLTTSYTWATLPSAAANSGTRVRVTDVGPNGSDWISNGTDWVPVNGFAMIARSAVASSVTGTTTETTLATITIPAGVMGTNGQLWIMTLWSNTSNANNKTLRVRFSGIAGTQYLLSTATTGVGSQIPLFIRNRNSASSQIGGNSSSATFGHTASAAVTSAVDTSLATTLVISGQLANAGDTLTLESYTVELKR